MWGTRHARVNRKGSRVGTRRYMTGTEQRQDALILSRHKEIKWNTAVCMHAQQERTIRVGTPPIQPPHRGQEARQTLLVRRGERLPTRPEMEAPPCDPKEASELIPGQATDTAQLQKGRTGRLGLRHVHAAIGLRLRHEGVIRRGIV